MQNTHFRCSFWILVVIEAFCHRFCGFNNNLISETVILEEKSLSLAKNPFILMGLEFPLNLEEKPDF